MLIATGDGTSTLDSVEIFGEGVDGNFTPVEECSGIPNFPFATSSATGAMLNDRPHICVGYSKDGEGSGECFGLETSGSWTNTFDLKNALTQWGASALFHDWSGNEDAWWIVGGQPDGVGTEVWGGSPPKEISEDGIKLPKVINRPCIAKISNDEVFVVASPKFEVSDTLQAWIYNIQTNTWTELPPTLDKRSGASCGYIQSDLGRFVVVAGGLKTSTTEILNLATMSWNWGPDIGSNAFGASMISTRNGELLLIGGYDQEALSAIRRLNSRLSSWDVVGQLATPRFNAVVLDVPYEVLSRLC